MSLIAITGATGFVGSHLLDVLAETHEVRALTRGPQPRRRHVEWVPGSLEDEASLERLVAGAAAVVHVAGAVKGRGQADFFAANVRGSRNLVHAVKRRARDAHLVAVSTLAAREPQLSHYTASKRAAELALEELGQGLSWTVVRPPGVYGPGDSEILKLIRAAGRGVLPVPGSPDNRVSLIYGCDLAECLARCVSARELAGRTLEVHDGAQAGYSYRELAEHLADVLARPVWPVRVPPSLLLTAARIGGLWAAVRRRPTMLSVGKARELLHPDWVAQPDDVLASVWRPRTSLAEGLQATVDWARRQALL